MSYYADLTPYEYLGVEPGVINVGWLEAPNSFLVAGPEPEVVRRLANAARYARVNQTRGFHVCSFCPVGRPIPEVRVGWKKLRLGSAELRVKETDVTYAAPDLIVHYVRDHGYSPPPAFVAAIMRMPIWRP